MGRHCRAGRRHDCRRRPHNVKKQSRRCFFDATLPISLGLCLCRASALVLRVPAWRLTDPHYTDSSGSLSRSRYQMKILTAAEMREVDRLTTEKYGVPSLTLMENAGKSAAEFIQARFPNFKSRPIVVLCGKGNNGGDGFGAARHLRKMGAKVRVYL